MIAPVGAADASVTTCNLTGTGSITSAVATANSGGGTITYTLSCSTNFSSSSGLQITNNVTIDTNGFNVVYNGNSGSRRFFRVSGSGTLTINGGVTFQNGSITLSLLGGGAIHNAGSLNLSNVTFNNNRTAVWGGGAIFNTGTATINNVTFSNNASNIAGGGGAIANTGTLNISNSTFTDNSANIVGGGAIYNLNGNSTINDSTFTGNNGLGGGAITNVDSPMTINNSTFTNNNVDVSGGAVWNSFNGAIINNSTFTNNSADVSGGAIFNSNVVNIDASSFIDNSADFLGGAIENYGTVNATNSTFSGNSSATGGAIHNGFGTTNLTYVTLHGNMGTGGNVAVSDGTVNSTASIFSDGDCSGAIGDVIGNIQNNAAGCVGANTDPMLEPLTAGVHVPTNTAIEHTPPCSVGTDQLGNARPTGTNCTAGAVEIDDDAVVIIPEEPAAPIVLVIGCVFDTPNGVELADVPDDTYCRVLMRDGRVTDYHGAIPEVFINLGVIVAVDVYRLEGGRAVVEFPHYARVCLAGTGRYFYLDARTSPRAITEMPTEQHNGMTCAWIPATGTVILTER